MAIGQKASYRFDRATTWVARDNSKGRRMGIYATPSRSRSLARICIIIANYGIQIKPEHADLFNIPAMASA